MARQPLRSDIATAVRRAGNSVWGCGREVRRLENHLGHGERVRRLAGARYRGRIGIAVVTDRRLLFLVEGVFSRICDEFPFARINLIGWTTAWGAGTITIHSGNSQSAISGIATGVGYNMVGGLRHQMARIDALKQRALDRQDRLYDMVEYLYSLHIPEDTAAALTDGDLADTPAPGPVPVSETSTH
ncbi:MAG TPA: hypothetical protein VF867_16125 [Arthrobacter sp.]